MSPQTKVSSPRQTQHFFMSSMPLTRASLKVWLFLVVLALLHLFIGYRIAGRLGLFFGLMMAVTLTVLIFYYGSAHLLEKFQAKKLAGQDPWGLLEIAVRYSRLLGIACPSVFVAPSEKVFSFSLGHTWDMGAVCLSQGALEKLSSEEIEAVLVHQICHIRRLDTFAFGATSSLAHSLVGLATILDRAWPVNWFQAGMKQKPFLILISPLSWLLVRFAVSNGNFYENDDLAASLLPNRKYLAIALWKMESFSQTKPLEILPCTSHLFMVNPEGLKESNWFYVLHPPIANRIRRLVGSFPL